MRVTGRHIETFPGWQVPPRERRPRSGQPFHGPNFFLGGSLCAGMLVLLASPVLEKLIEEDCLAYYFRQCGRLVLEREEFARKIEDEALRAKQNAHQGRTG